VILDLPAQLVQIRIFLDHEVSQDLEVKMGLRAQQELIQRSQVHRDHKE